MIIGIGTDLVEIARIKSALQRHGDRLARRILTPGELERYFEHGKKAHYLAARFAAKEAASKALQSGIGVISWQDISVSNTSAGAPRLQLSGNARDLMLGLGARQTFLSLSDERNYALAFVVLSV